jgi:hypothetical protein
MGALNRPYVNLKAPLGSMRFTPQLGERLKGLTPLVMILGQLVGFD